jgi:hypothetical protein
MSDQIIKILIGGALLVHGVGHSLGFWMPVRSWLLPNASESTLRVVSSIIWVAAALGFVASVLSFWGILIPGDLWRQLALVFAVVSLLGLILFFGTWPTFNTIGAFGMNIAILVTQLLIHWPPEEMFGK